jgi:hypothetical protein
MFGFAGAITLQTQTYEQVLALHLVKTVVNGQEAARPKGGVP